MVFGVVSMRFGVIFGRFGVVWGVLGWFGVFPRTLTAPFSAFVSFCDPSPFAPEKTHSRIEFKTTQNYIYLYIGPLY